MTKKEIVKQISESCDLTQLKTKEVVQKTFEAIIDTLVTEHRIELRNFGVFEVKKRAARKARNPRSGDRVDVPEKYVVTFKPGKEMEERVLALDSEEAASNASTPVTPAASSPPDSQPATSEPSSTGSPAPQPYTPAPPASPTPQPPTRPESYPSNPSPPGYPPGPAPS